MYRILQTQGINYDLKLGRKMATKLRPFLQGKFRELDYGNYLEKLLEKMQEVFCAYLDELPQQDALPVDDDGFISYDGMEPLPFD